MACKKCKTDTQIPGRIYFLEQESLYLCRYCCSVIEDIGEEKLNHYLNDKNLDLVKNRITKNIIQARMNRNVSEQNEGV